MNTEKNNSLIELEMKFYEKDKLVESHFLVSNMQEDCDFYANFAELIFRLIGAVTCSDYALVDTIIGNIIDEIPWYTETKHTKLITYFKWLIDRVYENEKNQKDIDKNLGIFTRWINKQCSYYDDKKKGGKEAIGKQIDVLA